MGFVEERLYLLTQNPNLRCFLQEVAFGGFGIRSGSGGSSFGLVVDRVAPEGWYQTLCISSFMHVRSGRRSLGVCISLRRGPWSPVERRACTGAFGEVCFLEVC